MKKRLSALFIAFLMLLLASPSSAVVLSARLKGKILLQVEANGEAWYVNPDNASRYYMGRPADAFALMRDLGLGISNKDFNSYQGFAPTRLSGKILLQVEANGEAWYVDPTDLKMHFLGRPADAFAIMRELGLGISNNDLKSISIASGYDIPEPAPPAEEPGQDEPGDSEEPGGETVCSEAVCQEDSLISYNSEAGSCVEVVDDCSDCSCACGGFNTDENTENNNCEDGLDNDCDSLIDAAEAACQIAGTEVAGKISLNTTWNKSGDPYIVTGDIEVLSNATLTIDPGVTVKFKPAPAANELGGYELLVRGGLMAKGTAGNIITFTALSNIPGRGDWWGIEVVDGGTLELEYTDIEYAQNGVSATNNRLANIKKSTIKNCQTAVLTSGPGEISDNYINGNNAGLVVQTDTGSPRDSGTYSTFNIKLIDVKYNTIRDNTGGADDPDQAGVVIKDVTTPDIRLNLEFNDISLNTSGINFTGTNNFNNLTIDKNNIADNFEFNVWFNTGGGTVTLENNWWGTTAVDPITDKIFDYFDVSHTLPQADYQPISLVANASAGVR